MDVNWLLRTAFVTAVRFREASGSSAPRAVLPISLDPDGKFTVVEEGLMAVRIQRWTIDELTSLVWPDLQLSFLEAAVQIDRKARSWLPCGPEARLALNTALQKGEAMAKKKVKDEVPEKAVTTSSGYPGVYIDAARRTALGLKRSTDGRTLMIAMAEGEPFDLAVMDDEMFDRRYDRLPDYPVERAAKLFVSYATVTGATPAALKELGHFVNIGKKEIEMATAKKAAAAAKKPAPAAKKVTAKAAAAAAKGKGKAAAKGVRKGAANGTAKEPKTPRGDTAAAMFQELLLEGKHTDDVIFGKVAAKFNLDEKKRGYVGWYRNYLRKQGKTVADPLRA